MTTDELVDRVREDIERLKAYPEGWKVAIHAQSARLLGQVMNRLSDEERSRIGIWKVVSETQFEQDDQQVPMLHGTGYIHRQVSRWLPERDGGRTLPIGEEQSCVTAAGKL